MATNRVKDAMNGNGHHEPEPEQSFPITAERAVEIAESLERYGQLAAFIHPKEVAERVAMQNFQSAALLRFAFTGQAVTYDGHDTTGKVQQAIDRAAALVGPFGQAVERLKEFDEKSGDKSFEQVLSFGQALDQLSELLDGFFAPEKRRKSR